ncbi:MAG: 23S rRNA (adenine(2503)-C(2))-methyltransferase RlmN [Candidatus Nanopelagicales bacterium]|nr:23S rRNA (adenine(2503)-C(2))-methyltransferase RlmN [Candidatus Nanopelagicales bacterium]
MPVPGELIMIAPRRGKPPKHFIDLDVQERRAAVSDLGLPVFRADQISRQWFSRLSFDPAEWSDISPRDAEVVQQNLLPQLLAPVRQVSCDDDATIKSVWRLHDGSLVESVLMDYGDRVTICVSSQAGCGMNCPFCATGQAGLTRNLSAAEITQQVLNGSRWVRDLPDGHQRVSNVVFMGMGEPLANYSELVTTLRRLINPAPDGLGMSARGITVSTVGLVPRIRQLADEGMQVRLAVSLHAPDDELRDTLVPINTRWPIAEVLDAAWHFGNTTGRRVSIEYALIRDINDQAERARELARLLRGQRVHVNLIPLNPTPGSIWTASRRRDERTFVKILRDAGISTTVRDTRGQEIDGACGQLAAVTEATPK